MTDNLPKGSVVLADSKEVDNKVKDYLERAEKIMLTWITNTKNQDRGDWMIEIAKMIQIQDERDKLYV